MPLKAAIIGTGHIARQHLACLRELPGVQVAGVCDLSRAMAESAADRFGVVKWYTDHRRMLEEAKPDVVHVTTPPPSHFSLSMDALNAGAHVIVEKPATVHLDDLLTLTSHAKAKDRVLLEDFNYVFNTQVQKILGLVKSGAFGAVTHVEVFICLDILAPGNPFVDPNVPHPALSMAGGAIADFLTHLASLAHAFVGPHRSVRCIWTKRGQDHPLPSDEFRALADCERGTASLGFSAHTQPDVFWLRVYGTKMRAAANLFEPLLTIDRVRGGPKPLVPLLNGRGAAKDARRAAYGGLWRKLSGGPGAYEGLWELVGRTYKAIEQNAEPPISTSDIEEVNRLVADLKKQEYTI
jgi:predicted dehydrogenase